MHTRRKFMGQMLGGATALAARRGWASARILGANGRVRFGLIGAGGRGTEILEVALKCANVECVAVADIYARRLDEVRAVVPAAKAVSDFRRLLDDKSIDAVLIATPQHQHALNFVPALQAGKDVYQEKTMAFNPDHGRRMKRAFEGSGRVVQVGIQSTSGLEFQRVRELATAEAMGHLTAIHTHHYRNSPYGGWMRAIPADCDPAHVDWAAFQGEASPHDFSGDRVVNWRFYWDYSGGNVFENMVHQVGFWYKVFGLKPPARATMSGANLLSPNMQVPDMMDVSLEQPEGIFFTWNSGFGNRFLGEGYDLALGNQGTILRNDERGEVRYVPEGKRKHEPTPAASGKTPSETPDIVGAGDDTLPHMQNFFDCVRSRQEPNCPFEIGYRSAIACQMAITSLRLGRTVVWDAEREEIV